MNVIIAGGSGLLGQALSRRLVANGHKVWALTRVPGKKPLPAGVEPVRWDGKTAQGWGSLVEEAGAIVNLTGESLAAGRWTAARKQRILASRTQTGAAIVEAVRAAQHKPDMVLQIAGSGYYGVDDTRQMDESSPPGNDFLANISKAWEASTHPVTEMGVRHVIARSAVVLTTHGITLKLIMLPFRLFVGGPLGSGKQPLPWIHISDQVAAVQFLLEAPDANGVYNVVAPQQLTNAQFGKILARVLKRPYWFPTPAFLLKLAVGEMSTVVLEGQRVVPKRLQEAGFKFRYPEAEGALRDLVKNKR